ncbi:MAG: corrinoid protein [Candidatus Geothermincolia bacterium]
MEASMDKLREAMVALELDEIVPLVRRSLDAGAEPQAVLGTMSAAMAEVGRLFQEGEYFLADLVIAGEAMKEGVEVLEPLLAAGSRGDQGTVVLCTVKGDIHDIGKNLVGVMLSSAGFKVIDLGVDVPEQRVVEAVREHQAGAVALSVLLTTMVGSISAVIDALTEAGLRDSVKVAIGGACTTEELAAKLGADAMGRDAVEAVKLCESWLCA